MHNVLKQQVKEERARETRRHLGHLDALRGIAVLGVVMIHSGQSSPSRWDAIAFSGQRGVQLFFVVSAFTLMLSGDNRKTEPRATAAFFLRRFFRLAPMYYPCIVLSWILSPVLHFTWLPMLLSVLFLHNLSVHSFYAGTFGGWSLGNEALFYLSLPLLYRLIRNLRASIVAFLAATVVSMGISRLLLHLYPIYYDYWMFYWFVTEAPIFLMGIVTYFAWKEHLRGLQDTPLARQLSAILLLITAALYLASLPLDELKLVESSMACATLLAALSLYPWKFLVNRFTMFMGKISYSIYLTHFFLLDVGLPWFRSHRHGLPQLVPNRTLHLLLTYVATLAISTGISTLTWLFVEEPGIRLGRIVIARLQGRGPNGAKPLVQVSDLSRQTSTPDAQF